MDKLDGIVVGANLIAFAVAWCLETGREKEIFYLGSHHEHNSTGNCKLYFYAEFLFCIHTDMEKHLSILEVLCHL